MYQEGTLRVFPYKMYVAQLLRQRVRMIELWRRRQQSADKAYTPTVSTTAVSANGLFAI